MGPIVIYHYVNTIGREYNWTRKDCPQIMTVGYNGLTTSTELNTRKWSVIQLLPRVNYFIQTKLT